MTSQAPPPLPDPNSAVRTYLRAVALLIPTIFVWLFANSFLLPKLQQIWQLAGLTNSKAQFLMDASYGLQRQFPFVMSAVVIIFFSLEIRWKAWPRYRRVVVACAALFFHTTVLVGVTSIATAAMLAVPRMVKTK